MADHRLERASEWAARLNVEDDASKRSFEAWRADPANGMAWKAVIDAQRSAAVLADHPELLALRHATIARTVRDRSYRVPNPAWAFAAAACAVLAAPLAWMMLPTQERSHVVAASPAYRTDVGQRLAVTLPDGSHLTLNTQSRVRVAYNANERRLILEQGQALFEVAKHQRRPFVVVAGGQEVTAHGTQFDVRLDAGTTQVALIEGRVSVAPASSHSGSATAMTVDDVLVATTSGVSIRHVPGGASALASWSEGRLVFADQPLSAAVAEMNRYSSRSIRIVDQQAARLRVSGSFRIGEEESFVSALQAGFPVTVRSRTSGTIDIAYRR